MSRFFFVFLLVLSSCVAPAPLYRPDSHVVPMFEEDEKVQIAANISAYSGYGAEIILSPIHHMILFGRGTISNTDRFNQHYWEVGAGGYVSASDYVFVELIGGMGQGNPQGKGSREIESEESLFPVIETYLYEAAHDRIYGQINVGAIVDSEDLMVGGAFRFSQTTFRSFSSQPVGLFEKVEGLFLEPALVVRAPLFDSIFLEGEMGTSIPLKRTNWELFETQRRYASIGVRYQFGW